jgi:ribose-phosphate pyrophosphokinase
MKIVISCSHGRHLGKKIASAIKAGHLDIFTQKFPDDELSIRIETDVKGKEVYLVQSFYRQISDCIIEVILAANTAKELGAKKVHLIAPYFPYLRQDKRFHPGESVSQYIIAGLIDRCCDSVTILDPHLHRTKSLGEIFREKTTKLTCNELVADYIKKRVKNPVCIGPDGESYKWAKFVGDMIGVESRVMAKKRYSSFHVEVKLNKPIDLKGKTVVIIDDIVSTGHTIIEASKLLRKIGAKKILCICVHSILVGDALKKFRKAKIELVSCNTIPNPKMKIDVSGMIGKHMITM